MFAARTDQENLAYDHQRAAAAKPLNQTLGVKTPANNKAPKTPFRKQLNDENDAFNTGFRTGKKGDGLFTKGKKPAELDKNAFVTPAGPRSRAPLGMKTTNAKGAMPKTPALAKESAQKTVSPRMRRPKVKIHHEDPDVAKKEPKVPDVEYMAPRSIPLPDHPDDFADHCWDMLDDPSLAAGWYMNPVGEDGLTRLERERKQMLEASNRYSERTIRKALENDPIASLDVDNLQKYFDKPVKSATTKTTKKEPALRRAPSTLSSKRAADALSAPAPTLKTRPSVPRFAAPTANTTARKRSPTPGLAGTPAAAPVSRKNVSSAPAPTAASMRHAAVSATSKSTLGYSKGRAVSATARQPLSSIFSGSAQSSRPTTASSARSLSAISSDIKEKQSPAFMKQKALLESLITADPELEMLLLEKNGAWAEEAPLHEGSMGPDLFEEDDELKDFQLEIPQEDDKVKVSEEEKEDEVKGVELTMAEE